MAGLTVTQNLIMLERRKEELLLLNSPNLQPLYIRNGQDYIKRFIEGVKDRSYNQKEIKAEFPGDRRLIDMLLAHRILIDTDEKEESHDRSVVDFFENGQSKSPAMSLYLLLSQSCNLGCVYCLNGSETYKTDKGLKMGDKVAFRSVEKCLGRLDEQGTLEIAFFGGEPLLN